MADSLDAATVLDELRRTVRLDPEAGPGSRLAPLVARARDVLRWTRDEPFGGRGLAVKRLAFHLTSSASTFDRTTRVDEALLELMEALIVELEVERARSETRLARLEANVTRLLAARGEDPGPGRPLGPFEARLAGAPAELLPAERLVLLALVSGLRPRACLEIGTFRGGSADLICAALDAAGAGRLVCLDPRPQIAPETLERLAGRATLLRGDSPAAIPEAARLVGGSFDFVFVDGDHGRAGVAADLEGCLPFLADGAHVLLHDAHFRDVRAGIDDVLARHPELVDAGLVSTEQNPVPTPPGEPPVVWGGLRLLRFTRRG